MRILRRFLLGVVIGMAATGALAQERLAQERLALHLVWRHQAQFAGFYIAQTDGLFAAQGLTVDLVEGGPGIDPLQQLAAGKVDIAIGRLAHAIELRQAGADIVNIAQLFQHPGTLLACRRKPGLAGRLDLAGKTIGVWHLGDDVDLRHWLQREGISTASVRMVPQQADGRDLIEGRADCVTAMSYNEYWKILDARPPSNDLFMVDFSGLLEDGLYVRRASLDSPAAHARLARFLAAAAEGWARARRRPEAALTVVLARAPGLDPLHQGRMLHGTLQLIDGRRPFGRLDPAAYARAIAILAQQSPDPGSIRDAARNGWTHSVLQDAGLDPKPVELRQEQGVATP
ncbi:nitrate ABC transporter substrate-binding protein [Allostella vacuolata]|nr:nitrate ABC transporter substrate-binding protein [Stella vacuolata]